MSHQQRLLRRRIWSVGLCVALIAMLIGAGGVRTSLATEAASDKFLVRYQAGAKPQAVAAVQDLGGVVRFEFDAIQVLAVTLEPAQVDTLAQRPAIVKVTADPKVYLQDESVPYGIDMVRARDTWDANRDSVIDAGAPTGSGITVCIIDTGIYAAHEDLGGGGVAILRGRSWVNEPWDGDLHGHGTHVAGTVAAAHNSVGVVGVSPGHVQLLIADVFNNAGESQESSVILDAVNWCAEQGADIISMSLGGPGFDDADLLGAGYQAIYDQGVLIVAAAGNDGGPVNSYPASHAAVVSVAAVDDTGTVASFSNFVPDVEVAAPGVDVLSTWPVENAVVVEGGPRYNANSVEFASERGIYSGALADGGTCESPTQSGAYTGKIVLCQRANLPFKAKIDNAAAGGAVGVILYNNVPGNFNGTYALCCSPIPALSLSLEDGQDAKNNHLGTVVTLRVQQGSTTSYAVLSGTSMATPHASAVAAVLWSACPTLTNDQVRSQLSKFAMEPEADGLDGRDIFYGYGIVQLKDAVDALSDGINEYNPANRNSDGSRPANVECGAATGITTTGGGWLAGASNKKVNFGFELADGAGGPTGSLQVNDKVAGAKINLAQVTYLGEATNACSAVVDGPGAVEIRGNGSFNGASGASFRACVQDNGEPGRGVDRFSIECTAGCSYASLASTGNAVIDNGNIDVSPEPVPSPGQPTATTMILSPLLQSEGVVGQVQLLNVRVYDQHQRPLRDAEVLLARRLADGSVQTLSGMTDLTGTAAFSVVHATQAAEYVATSGAASSNAVEVSPLLR